MIARSIAPVIALLASGALAVPTPQTGASNTTLLSKRYEASIDHCINGGSLGDEPNQYAGNIYVVDNGDNTYVYTCAEAFGVMNDDNPDGIGPVKTSDGFMCYLTTGDPDSVGDRTACPGDPPPSTNRDGSPSDIVEGTVDAFCAVAGSGGAFGFVTFAGCFAWSFVGTGGDPAAEAEAGATAICDTIFSGLCTFLESGAGDIGGGGSG